MEIPSIEWDAEHGHAAWRPVIVDTGQRGFALFVNHKAAAIGFDTFDSTVAKLIELKAQMTEEGAEAHWRWLEQMHADRKLAEAC